MNEKGLKLLKEFEGKRNIAYQDPVGIWTIGYGHTSAAGHPKVTKGLQLTDSECEELLKHDVVQYESAVKSAVKVHINTNQTAALTSFCYNIGIGGFKRSSALRELNKGNYDNVPERMALWNKAGGRVLRGLVRRRAAEGELFLSPVAGVAKSKMPDPMPKAEMQPGKPAAQSSTIWSAIMTALTSLVPLLVGMDWKIAVPLIVVTGGLAFWIIRERMKKSAMDGV